MKEFSEMIQHVNHIAVEQGLGSQNYTCKTCTEFIGVNFGPARYVFIILTQFLSGLLTISILLNLAVSKIRMVIEPPTVKLFVYIEFVNNISNKAFIYGKVIIPLPITACTGWKKIPGLS